MADLALNGPIIQRLVIVIAIAMPMPNWLSRVVIGAYQIELIIELMATGRTPHLVLNNFSAQLHFNGCVPQGNFVWVSQNVDWGATCVGPLRFAA